MTYRIQLSRMSREYVNIVVYAPSEGEALRKAGILAMDQEWFDWRPDDAFGPEMAEPVLLSCDDEEDAP